MEISNLTRREQKVVEWVTFLEEMHIKSTIEVCKKYGNGKINKDADKEISK